MAFARRGERIGTAYVRILADGSGFDESVEEQMDDSDGTFEKAGEDHSEKYWDSFEKETKKNEKFEKSLDKKFEKAKGKFQAIGDALGGELQNEIAQHIEELFTMRGVDEKRAREYGQRAGELWAEGFARSGNRNFDSMNLAARAFDSIEEDARKLARELEKLASKQKPVNDRFTRFSELVGRSFGKGSRNDFLNFVGSVMQGLAKISTKVINVGGYFEKFLDFTGNAITGGLQKLGFSEKAAGTISKVGGSLAAAGGAAAFLVAALGPIAGLISGLAGAITALASSVSFALGAGLGVFVGLLPFLAGGILATVGAFKGLNDIKGGPAVIDKFKDSFKGIDKQLAKGLLPGLQDLADAFSKITKTKAFSNFIDRVGDSLGDVASMFAKVVESPAFKRFGRTFSEFLPEAIRRFGRITKNIMGGFAGIFQGAMDSGLVSDFLKWIQKITGQFSRWANSKKGREEIVQFFERAAESAKTVGKFIAKVGEALGKLLFSNEGRKAGDTLFGDMTDKLEEFITFLQENPDTLKQWFEDGVEVAEGVGNAIMGIVDVFNALDTPENRELAAKIFEGFGKGVSIIAKVVDWLVKMDAFVKDQWSHTFGPIISKGWDNLKKGIEIGKKVYNWFKDLGPKIGDAFGKVKDKIGNWIDWLKDLPGKVKTILGRVIDWFKDLPGKVWGALQNAIQRIGDFVSRGREKFGDFVSTVREKMGDVVSWVREKISALPGIVTSFATKLLNAGKQLGGKVMDGIKQGLSTAGGVAQDIASGVRSALVSMINSLIDAINNAIPNSLGAGKLSVNLPDNPIGHVGAAGGLAYGPQKWLIGEAGREAVVPLDRPLSQVDPAVRELSAYAQGIPTSGSNTINRGVDVGGITIITPTEDPAAVADETLNRLVTATYWGG